jgi:hypothetical protein
MGTAFTPARTFPASWDAFSDVDVFIDAVLAELAAMAGTRQTHSRPKAPLTGAALRKAIMAIWYVCFCGLQWRAIGHAPLVSCATSRSAPSTRCLRAGPGSGCGASCSTARSWLDGRLAATNPYPRLSSSTAARVNRRRPALRAASMAVKKIKGIKIHLAVDKYGFP